MICLKNRTFAVSQTTSAQIHYYKSKLWFAWKIVLLQYRKQRKLRLPAMYSVVICLKNRTFAVSQTTWLFNLVWDLLLWFAWKIVLLQYRKQLKTQTIVLHCSCDLLEKSYFCSIANNSRRKLSYCIAVVICLKNRTFAVSQTTLPALGALGTELWFAWKIVLLQYRKQQ